MAANPSPNPPSPPASTRARVILLALIALCLLFVVSYTGRLVQRSRLQAEIQQWEERLAQEQARQLELQAELTYVSSADYVDEVAREELEMVRPGDTVIVVLEGTPIPTPTVTPTPAPATMAPETSSAPPWKQWWGLFVQQEVP